MTTCELNIAPFPSDTLPTNSYFTSSDAGIFSGDDFASNNRTLQQTFSHPNQNNKNKIISINEITAASNGEYLGEEKDCVSDCCDDEIDVEEDISVPASVLLTFNFNKTHIFTNPELNISTKPLFHEKCSLFRKPLIEFMEALQTHFSIDNDVALYFSQLKLKFYTHMPFTEVSTYFMSLFFWTNYSYFLLETITFRFIFSSFKNLCEWKINFTCRLDWRTK